MPRLPHAKIARVIGFGLRVAAAAQKAAFARETFHAFDGTRARVLTLLTLLARRRGGTSSFNSGDDAHEHARVEARR